MTEQISNSVKQLQEKNVSLPHPGSVFIDDSVDLDRIAPGVIIHPGCRISGKDTSIGPRCVLGDEAPVTLVNSQLENDVVLKGGFFSNSVFLSHVSFGSCGHVRPGTLLEEYVSCGHSVGLKQTMLMPFVTLGSLINFCDCLMAGGTGPKNHSEVGSSYIHFNFTVHQDKATASLIGDVPRGVLLDRPPIFLGGQGGIVGPVKIEYGTILAAGSICRHDVTKPGTLVFGASAGRLRECSYDTSRFGDPTKIILHNLEYLGNLLAMLQWYRQVRSLFVGEARHKAACHQGAIVQIMCMMRERLIRMSELADKMPRSIEILTSAGETNEVAETQKTFVRRWPLLASTIESAFASDHASSDRDSFLSQLGSPGRSGNYIAAIQGLDDTARTASIRWMNSVVDSIRSLW